MYGLSVDDKFLESIEKLADNSDWSKEDIDDIQRLKDFEEVQLFLFYAFGARQVREKLGWEVPTHLRYFREIELPLRERDPSNSYAFLVSSSMEFKAKGAT